MIENPASTQQTQYSNHSLLGSLPKNLPLEHRGDAYDDIVEPLGKVVGKTNSIDQNPRFCGNLAIEGGWETSSIRQ